jgi:hypothetical protein
MPQIMPSTKGVKLFDAIEEAIILSAGILSAAFAVAIAISVYFGTLPSIDSFGGIILGAVATGFGTQFARLRAQHQWRNREDSQHQ